MTTIKKNINKYVRLLFFLKGVVDKEFFNDVQRAVKKGRYNMYSITSTNNISVLTKYTVSDWQCCVSNYANQLLVIQLLIGVGDSPKGTAFP
jgi:hypothetical protein